MRILDAIKKRRSVRTFQKIPLSREDEQFIIDYIKDDSRLIGPHGAAVRLFYLPGVNDRLDQGRRVGTYGLIRNAQGYVAASCEAKPESLLDLGYVLEKLILYLTDRAIGTCWLGGTFDRRFFSREIGASQGSIIPAVTPLGYIQSNQSGIERMARGMISADTKQNWTELFFDKDFTRKLTKQEAGKWAIPLEMLRLGPSASNKQPWRVVVDDNQAHLYLLRSRLYNQAMGFQIQRLDMGIAMCHLELAAKAMNISGEWIFLDPGLNVSSKDMCYIVSYSMK